MAKSLRLDSTAIYRDLRLEIVKSADRLAEQYFAEIQGAMKTSSGREDLSLEQDEVGDVIRRMVIGHADAIMDSYGTGSKMDTDNPALRDYQNSGRWNPARSGLAISGRPAGSYENIYGERVESSGALEGVNLEDMRRSPIKAREPSGAFQDAEKFLLSEGRMEKEVEACVKDFFAGVKAHPGKYFRFG